MFLRWWTAGQVVLCAVVVAWGEGGGGSAGADRLARILCLPCHPRCRQASLNQLHWGQEVSCL